MPRLPPKAIIIMDNATFHKRQDTQNMIQKAGHTLLFVTPYSRDLNPIEQKWEHTKSIRKHSMCSIEDLFKIESLYLG